VPHIDHMLLQSLLLAYRDRMKAREELKQSMEEAKQAETGRPGPESIIEGAHPKQAAAIHDIGRLIAVLGTRRAGKSRGFLRKMTYDALTIPNSYQIYINTSWPECRRIAWRGARPGDGLEGLNKDFNLGAEKNKTDHTFAFPNGSIIEMIGADNVPAIERALGIAPLRVWIDEAQKMPHLDYLIREILGPALTDFDGQVVLTGTASVNCSGLFFDITRPDSDLVHDDMWHFHKLTVLDNPFFGETRAIRYERTIRKHCKKFNLREDDPEVRREWFAEWVLDDANFVYHANRMDEEALVYAPQHWLSKPRADMTGGIVNIKACLADLPLSPRNTPYTWFFGLGVDIGYHPDPFAYTIYAWTMERPELFEVCSWKESGLIPDVQASIIAELTDQVGGEFSFEVADAGGGGKGIVKGWAQGFQERYPLPIDEAQKSQKATHIEFYNNDMRAGRIRLRSNSPLLYEMRKLTWTQPKGNARQVEDVRRDKNGKKRNANDCCDASLYAHREARHFRSYEVEDEPLYGTPEYWSQEEGELEELIVQRIAQRGQHGFFH
jgi:hypothetical protein